MFEQDDGHSIHDDELDNTIGETPKARESLILIDSPPTISSTDSTEKIATKTPRHRYKIQVQRCV
eukprot:scaffold175993_cov31-Prasinocladus_malaysianus.AAC.1